MVSALDQGIMVKIDLKHVVRDIDRHCNDRFYFRVKDQAKVRLPGIPGSEEFMETYQDALNRLLKNYHRVAMKELKFAVDRGIAKRNPVAEISKIRTKTDGHHTWTVSEVHKFEDRHPLGSIARLAMALLLYTGSRRGDVVLLGRQHIREGWLEFRHGKTRAEVDLPILPQLQTVLDATNLGHMTFLVTSFGKPFTANGFGNAMRQWCDQAGLPHCSSHGLRKAGATIAAENGASDLQLMAIFGWTRAVQTVASFRKTRCHSWFRERKMI